MPTTHLVYLSYSHRHALFACFMKDSASGVARSGTMPGHTMGAVHFSETVGVLCDKYKQVGGVLEHAPMHELVNPLRLVLRLFLVDCYISPNREYFQPKTSVCMCVRSI